MRVHAHDAGAHVAVGVDGKFAPPHAPAGVELPVRRYCRPVAEELGDGRPVILVGEPELFRGGAGHSRMPIVRRVGVMHHGIRFGRACGAADEEGVGGIAGDLETLVRVVAVDPGCRRQ